MATTPVNEGVREIFRVVTGYTGEAVTAESAWAGRHGVTSTPACRPARRGRSSA
jgi:hypothetical protein